MELCAPIDSWRPRSSDLTTFDFPFGNKVNNIVHSQKIRDAFHLKKRVYDGVSLVITYKVHCLWAKVHHRMIRLQSNRW